ncbi:MAG TPA: fused MFS/spermidine synthase, partial [Gemmatales bacterium]|nr:fused MFS/spermidine synthase [Gemmatales bacterium]
WGSWDSTRHGRLKQRPLAWFGMLEVLIGLWATVGLLLLPLFHDWWVSTEKTGMESMKPVIGILTCVAMVLPVSFFFGLQFPVAVRSCMADGKQPGKSTSWAYTMNTLGTIVGSLLAGFFLLPYLGTAVLMMLVAGLNVVLGLVLLSVTPREERGQFLMPALGLAGLFVLTAVLAGNPYHKAMVARVHSVFGDEGVIYSEHEGSSATTVAAGHRTQPRQQTLLINGVGMTILCTETKLMTHLPYLLAEKPKRMLIICFGMGTTFRTAVMNYPQLHVDVVDIVPEVFDCFHHYHKDAAEVRKRPNGQMHADDGRNFLLTHRDAYDVITIDPAPPLHSAGTVNLYTKEFFELCKSRLTPGGVLCMWLPPAPEPEMLMIMRSYHEVFPEGSLWGALEFQGFYLIGGHKPVQPTQAQLQELYTKLSSLEDLGEWTKSYRDPVKLQQLYLLGGSSFGRLVKDVPAVTDDKPYTEFPIWRQFSYPSGAKDYVADDVRKRLTELLGASKD